MEDLDIVGDGRSPVTHCAVLEDGHLGVLLTVGVLGTAGLPPARLRALARTQLAPERPRAACISVLDEARKSGAAGPMAAAAVRFRLFQQSDDFGLPVAKRPRTEGPGLT